MTVKKLKYWYFKVETFTPKVEINIENQNYRLKTVTSSSELKQVIEMRSDIFLGPRKVDLDNYDSKADHLIISEKKTGRCVGTYRLLSSLSCDEFYSEKEFEIKQFLDLPGNKLELGRACIDPHHRSGEVIQILWRGIAEYASITRSRYLFGCSSVNTLNPVVIEKFIDLLKGHTKNTYQVRPKNRLRLVRSYNLDDKSNPSIPPLLRAYLSAGGSVHGEPFVDYKFRCIDFFTTLDLTQINESFRRRFLDARN